MSPISLGNLSSPSSRRLPRGLQPRVVVVRRTEPLRRDAGAASPGRPAASPARPAASPARHAEPADSLFDSLSIFDDVQKRAAPPPRLVDGHCASMVISALDSNRAPDVVFTPYDESRKEYLQNALRKQLGRSTHGVSAGQQIVSSGMMYTDDAPMLAAGLTPQRSLASLGGRAKKPAAATAGSQEPRGGKRERRLYASPSAALALSIVHRNDALSLSAAPVVAAPPLVQQGWSTRKPLRR